MENKIQQGYKGKGMCSNCYYSYDKTSPNGKKFLMCQKYGKWCYLVSRNCPGIPIFKPK